MYRFAVSTLWAACAITACGGERVSSRYLGITVANPTGSADISSDGLVAAYDMETFAGFIGNEIAIRLEVEGSPPDEE